jgi:hypothetical protein
MQDMIAIGEAWFEQQRRQHLAVEVEYRPLAGLPRTCKATVVTGRWESLDAAGTVLRMETRDFFIHRDELPQDPKKGDVVAITEYDAETTYEVMIPPGAQHHWRWSDRNQAIRRIHTMVKQGAAAVIDESLLVRAIGVSTAAAITDEQIAAQLTLDLGTNRVLAKQLTPAAAYVYVVLPESFGAPLVSVNGFRTTALELTSRSITFDGQTSRSYRIYRSTYPVTGTLLVEVA